MNQYTAQTTVRLSVSIKLVATGAATDPTTTGLKIREPDGTVTDLTGSVVHDALGNFHGDFTPTKLGLHMYEWLGTGSASVVGRGQFLVNQTTF
jgi:hypothetical protein